MKIKRYVMKKTGQHGDVRQDKEVKSDFSLAVTLI